MSNLRHLVANARNFLYTCQGVNKKYLFFSRTVYRSTERRITGLKYAAHAKW